MRDAFVKTVIDIAKGNPSVELLTADLGFGVLKPFFEQLPDQFTNVGIAEQNMISIATGLALEGKTVFAYSIANFPTLRCLEQIRNGCAYHKANVKIVCVGGGFVYGSLGMSHHATEDIAVMRALPNVAVFAPGDAAEAQAVTKAIARYTGTCYMRLGRGGEKRIHESINDFQIGKAIQIQQGKRVAIFSTGAIFDEVEIACKELKDNGIIPTVYTFPTVKPIDVSTIVECSQNHELIVTCEEHSVVGGFGSAVAEIMAENPTGAKLLRIGINDQYCSKVGSQKYLRDEYGMSGRKIADKIISKLR